MSKKEIAMLFGSSLDNDDYSKTRSVLAEECTYIIGEEVLVGPVAISKSYEDNMIAGRKKLDKLEWGQSNIEEINETDFFCAFYRLFNS